MPDFITTARDLWIAGDPGLIRFYSASRALLTVLINLALMALAARWLPVTVPLAGLYLGLLTSVMVNDPTKEQQKVTTLAAAATGSLLFCLGSWIAEQTAVVHDLLFPLATAWAVYARKYKARGNALGLVGYFSLFISQAYRTALPLLGWTFLCIAVGVSVAYFVKFYLLPDRSQLILRTTLAAFQARIRLLQRDQEDARLNEVAFALDTQLKALGAQELRKKVLSAELEVSDEHDWILPTVPSGIELSVASFRGAGPPHHPARLALQAALAGGLALLLGEQLAPARWYWAVIAAHLVFAQVRSLGDTLARALARLAGTILGVAAGVAIASALHVHPVLEMVGLLVFLFAAYYQLKVSYFGMITCITVVLSLLYSLLGRFRPGLMETRLLLTFAGAGAGSLVAVLVLPLHTWDLARQQSAEILRKIAGLLEGDCSLDDLRQIDSLLFDLRRIGTAATGLPLGLGPTPHLIAATTRVAYAIRHLVLSSGAGSPGIARHCREVALRLEGKSAKITDRPTLAAGKGARNKPLTICQ